MSDVLIRVLLAGFLGLLISYFLSIIAYRLPLTLLAQPTLLSFNHFIWSRPYCPRCQTKLTLWHTLPLLSFFILKGRCAYCHHPIGWPYPMLEAIAALSFGFLACMISSPLMLFATLWLTSLLLLLAVIDLETGLLPDVLTQLLLWTGLLFHLEEHSVFLSEYHIPTLSQAVLGAACGYSSLWVLYWIFRLLTGKEGMGYGDFKLFAALGAWLGWLLLPLVIILSSVMALLMAACLMMFGRMQHQDPLPFGPFLALSGWISWLWGDRILEWYLHYGH